MSLGAKKYFGFKEEVRAKRVATRQRDTYHCGTNEESKQQEDQMSGTGTAPSFEELL